MAQFVVQLYTSKAGEAVELLRNDESAPESTGNAQTVPSGNDGRMEVFCRIK